MTNPLEEPNSIYEQVEESAVWGWERKKKNNERKQRAWGDLWYIMNPNNILIMGVPAEGEKMGRRENIWRNTWPKTYSNLMTNINLHIQEAKQIPSKVNLETHT